MKFHDATVRVRYAETDQMGVVYHANYLIWFEIGRVELMRALGFEYKLMRAFRKWHILPRFRESLLPAKRPSTP